MGSILLDSVHFTKFSMNCNHLEYLAGDRTTLMSWIYNAFTFSVNLAITSNEPILNLKFCKLCFVQEEALIRALQKALVGNPQHCSYLENFIKIKKKWNIQVKKYVPVSRWIAAAECELSLLQLLATTASTRSRTQCSTTLEFNIDDHLNNILLHNIIRTNKPKIS